MKPDAQFYKDIGDRLNFWAKGLAISAAVILTLIGAWRWFDWTYQTHGPLAGMAVIVALGTIAIVAGVVWCAYQDWKWREFAADCDRRGVYIPLPLYIVCPELDELGRKQHAEKMRKRAEAAAKDQP